MTLWSYRILAACNRYLKAGEEPGGRIGPVSGETEGSGREMVPLADLTPSLAGFNSPALQSLFL